MKSRLLLAIVLLAAGCLALWIISQRAREGPGQEMNRTVVTNASDSATGSGSTAPTSMPPPRVRGDDPTTSNVAPEVRSGPTTDPSPGKIENEFDLVQTMVRDYRLRYGENPVGTNDEITKTLAGANPKSVRFLPVEGARLNAKGELLDPWDTPYFFHQVSRSEMEIRSAGPDRKMWTQDDRSTQ